MLARRETTACDVELVYHHTQSNRGCGSANQDYAQQLFHIIIMRFYLLLTFMKLRNMKSFNFNNSPFNQLYMNEMKLLLLKVIARLAASSLDLPHQRRLQVKLNQRNGSRWNEEIVE